MQHALYSILYKVHSKQYTSYAVTITQCTLLLYAHLLYCMNNTESMHTTLTVNTQYTICVIHHTVYVYTISKLIDCN